MGVKQLWTLLSPVGRPVLLETMEGKALAIDSSIWIYQFQATMRDKEGRGLVNAHLLGFLRRICKLLFYGIKPVFVFDGGAPALKRSTITERKRRKAGAALSHAKVAERLLAAQLRREAISHVKNRQSATKPGTADNEPTAHSMSSILNENTVYLEDLLPPVTPSPRKTRVIEDRQTPPLQAQTGPPESPNKYEWKDHDPYKLPDVDMRAKIAAATRISDPREGMSTIDPRLASEDELRHFIDTMRPEDFDANSPAFRELSTELQYEIIGDLRLKSRTTSHSRLQEMLRSSRTALDFSKAQIRGLHARNRLTQQLLLTTNSMGKEIDHHIMIPVRIAAERNREYVLMKRDGPEGGWSLGIRDEGTKEKPIQVKEESDDDSDMEVAVRNEPPLHYSGTFDTRRMPLASIGKANLISPKKSDPPTPAVKSAPREEPLFAPLQDVDSDHIDDDFTPEIHAAIEESLEEQEARDLQAAMEQSRNESQQDLSMQSDGAGPSRSLKHDAFVYEEDEDEEENDDDFEEVFVASPVQAPKPFRSIRANLAAESLQMQEGMEVVSPVKATLPESKPLVQESIRLASTGSLEPPIARMQSTPIPFSSDIPVASTSKLSTSKASHTNATTLHSTPAIHEPLPSSLSMHNESPPAALKPIHQPLVSPLPAPLEANIPKTPEQERAAIPVDEEEEEDDDDDDDDMEEVFVASPPPQAVVVDRSSPVEPTSNTMEQDEDEDEPFADWSRSPSPSGRVVSTAEKKDEEFDAANEMNVEEEEDAFVDFMTQVKGKDLDAVRLEIDQEIKELNKAKKAHQRDSEEITQQMVGQIMMLLRLFGIPYITAPMEAEAQCAELLSLGLVEGVITDDSDVFLFGATRVFKNMFNQSKTVECFLASDLQRELSLDQEKLISLAYLLGSDYVDGMEGVGPVVAMELLTEFDQNGGCMDTLRNFKEWWNRVQMGRDHTEEGDSSFKKRFKKKFKKLHLSGEWPNPAVRDAYLHPTVDESDEKFKWGLPDLDALRTFLGEELRWSQVKIDDLLLPIIRKMGQRNRNVTVNKQGTLNGYFDTSGGFGSGTMAPRKRQPYASKRLQKVVTEYRKSKDKKQIGSVADDMDVDEDEGENEPSKGPKKRKASNSGKPKRTAKKAETATIKPPKKKRRMEEESSGNESAADEIDSTVPDRPLGVSLRTRKSKAMAVVEESEGSDA